MRSKERVRWAQLRVGFVSAVALLILAVVLYLVTGGALFTENTTLYLYVPDATGVAQGSPVRVDGIDVGKVGDVSLSGSKDLNRVVRLTLTVARNSLAMIPTGSYAELGTDSPIGDKFVDITSAGRGPITPNSEIPYKAATDMFKTLDFEQFQANLRQMDAILTEIETGKSRVGQFVMGTQLYTDVRKRIAEIEKSITTAASTTTELGQQLYTDRLYRRITTPVIELDRALARLQSGQGAGRMLTDAAQYEQAVATVKDLRASIDGFRHSDLVQSDALYADVGRMIGAWTQTVDQLNAGPLFAAPQTYESLNGMARELEKSMRDFRGNPKKYMRLKVF
jgi:phospholipid/cholesterol/gamma-HCH transport system substrate-binding protein